MIRVKVTQSRNNLATERIQRAVERTKLNLAKRIKDEIETNIDTNFFNFELSETYLRAKERLGYDLRPFIATGVYRNSIEVWRPNSDEIMIGFRRRKHPNSDLILPEIAGILEYGSLIANIPPRPLWRMTYEEMSDYKYVGNMLKKFFKKIIR